MMKKPRHALLQYSWRGWTCALACTLSANVKSKFGPFLGPDTFVQICAYIRTIYQWYWCLFPAKVRWPLKWNFLPQSWPKFLFLYEIIFVTRPNVNVWLVFILLHRRRKDGHFFYFDCESGNTSLYGRMDGHFRIGLSSIVNCQLSGVEYI